MFIQVIYDRPRRILIGSYTTKKGQVKNRYRIDKKAIPVKFIKHLI